MNQEQKLAFIANMTDKALMHVAKTPNVAAPDGKMSHEKMLSFVQTMTKQGMQHFDVGGTVIGDVGMPINPGNIPAPIINGTAPKTTPGGLGGGVSNILGTTNKFQATAAPIQAGTDATQLGTAYTGVQGALGQQGAVTGILNNGLRSGATAQQNLAQMYFNQANGAGPNPAQAELNQATGQNIAQQAALVAGTRGGATNAGLIARENAQQGAATQQSAVGQAATLNAQQQLAAESNLQNLSANQIAQGTSATQGLNNAQQNEQGILQGANTSLNNANVSQQSNINSTNAAVATGNANTAAKTVSGIGNAIVGGALGLAFADGGEVSEDAMPWHKARKMATGGVVGQQTAAPVSYVGQWLNSNVQTSGPTLQPGQAIDTSGANPFDFKAKDKKAATLPSTTGAQLASNTAADVGGDAIAEVAGDPGEMASNIMYSAHGGLMKRGGKVDAKGKDEKAVKGGDSYANDKIPAMLSQGEFVIDRETMKDPGPMGQMARALAQHISKRNKK